MNRRYLTGADTVSFLLGGEGSGHRASWQILASRFFRNLWTLQQRYHVMDTDFWRMQVGKVPGVLVFYMFCIVFFQPFCWGSHRVPRWLYLSEFDRRRRSCMAWKLRVGRKADQKMVVVVRSSFWSNDKKVCFYSDILIWKRSPILPHFTTFPSKRSRSLSVLRLQTTLSFSIDGVDSPSSELTESEAQWFPCNV